MKYVLVFALILFSAIALADVSGTISPQYIAVWVDGECKYFNVSILVPGFTGEFCYDVKIDLFDNGKRVGEIYDLNEGWKSSYYYIENALCQRNGTFMVRADSQHNLTAIIKLKKPGETTALQAEIKIVQNCRVNDERVFLVALATILVFLWAITMYVKFWR